MGISVTIGGIFLYKSYAYYENEKEYNVIKGIIPDFSYDVKFAIEVDGNKSETIPKSSDTNNGKYYRVEATCDNNEKAEWDYNSWSIKVSNLQDGTKCKLAFTSDLSKEELDKYIEAGVAYRRTTYRGKDITSKLNDGSLIKEIKSCHFDDIYVGDYIVDNKSNQKDANGNKIRYLVADINNYLYTGVGDDVVTKCHVTMIPAAPLKSAKIYASIPIPTEGFSKSEMVTTTLPSILSTYITPVFENNVLTYTNRLCSQITEGKCTNWATLTNRKLDLMSEMNLTGGIIWSSSGFEIGVDFSQYAIFQLKPEIISKDSYGNPIGYWLKDMSDANNQVLAGTLITRANGNAEFGVRPRFLIG